jgi:hypothetical protein
MTSMMSPSVTFSRKTAMSLGTLFLASMYGTTYATQSLLLGAPEGVGAEVVVPDESLIVSPKLLQIFGAMGSFFAHSYFFLSSSALHGMFQSFLQFSAELTQKFLPPLQEEHLSNTALRSSLQIALHGVSHWSLQTLAQ